MHGYNSLQAEIHFWRWMNNARGDYGEVPEVVQGPYFEDGHFLATVKFAEQVVRLRYREQGPEWRRPSSWWRENSRARS